MNKTESLADRIKELVEQLHQELVKRAHRRGFPPPALVAHPPATESEIADYEAFLDISLPTSYRAFLSLYNGYDKLAFGGDVLSISDMMPGSETYSRILNWKEMCADYGAGEVLDGIVIANSRQPNNWVFLDPNLPTEENELAVVKWMVDTSQEYSNLIEYFESLISMCSL